MKPLTLLLSSLLLTAAFNLALDLGQQARFASLAPALASTRPPDPADSAFSDRLDRLTDPGLLRNLARVERAKRQDDRLLLGTLLGSIERMNRANAWRSGLLLALALGAFVVLLLAGARIATTGRTR